MTRAFFRLALITVLSTTVLVLAVFLVRRVGGIQAFAEPSHPWFQQAQWTIYNPPVEALCTGSTLVVNPKWIVTITAKHKDAGWWVACPDGPRALGDVIKKVPGTEFLLKIQAIDTPYLDNLVEIVEPFDKSKRFAIYSSSQRVAKYLRKKAPQWLFAADSASVMRLQLFESFWLETAIDFWPDFVITPQHQGAFSEIRERAAEELTRRHKRIIWDADAGTPRPEYPIHGVMTTRPSE